MYMAKCVLKLNEPVKIWNETVIVRPAEYDYFDCDICHFSHTRGYLDCPHNLCKQKIDNKQIYFATPE